MPRFITNIKNSSQFHKNRTLWKSLPDTCNLTIWECRILFFLLQWTTGWCPLTSFSLLNSVLFVSVNTLYLSKRDERSCINSKGYAHLMKNYNFFENLFSEHFITFSIFHILCVCNFKWHFFLYYAFHSLKSHYCSWMILSSDIQLLFQKYVC